MTTQMVSSQLELHRLNTNRVARVATANQILKQYLFRYQGYIGAALVLGGVDSTGNLSFQIYIHIFNSRFAQKKISCVQQNMFRSPKDEMPLISPEIHIQQNCYQQVHTMN